MSSDRRSCPTLSEKPPTGFNMWEFPGNGGENFVGKAGIGRDFREDNNRSQMAENLDVPAFVASSNRATVRLALSQSNRIVPSPRLNLSSRSIQIRPAF